MHGRITAPPDASAVRSGCDDCLLSPECPACTPGGAAGERGIDVLVRILHRGDRLFDDGEPFDNVSIRILDEPALRELAGETDRRAAP